MRTSITTAAYGLPAGTAFDGGKNGGRCLHNLTGVLAFVSHKAFADEESSTSVRSVSSVR